MTVRRFSQFLALSLAALTYWAMVSRPGVVEPDFAVVSHAAFAVMVVLFFGMSFVALRFATGGSATYWTLDRTDQVSRILWMTLAMLVVMLSANGVLYWLGRLNPAAAAITYLVAWTLIPAAFLQFGLITWPSRSSYLGRLKLVLISGLAIGLAAALSWVAWSGASDKSALPPVPEMIVTVGDVILGATLEEIVFRVLLLTALLTRTGSRFQAVVLSSVAFGLMHVPGALMDPVRHGDWAFLAQVAFEYGPQFLVQTPIGLFLGVLWLRTGSITLVALTHATLNMGNALAHGLLAYS